MVAHNKVCRQTGCLDAGRICRRRSLPVDLFYAEFPFRAGQTDAHAGLPGGICLQQHRAGHGNADRKKRKVSSFKLVAKRLECRPDLCIPTLEHGNEEE